ncbi:MAG: peptidase T [Bdellovibrionota bacterium]|nr:MAG: peptidase T [Bdellovibrionota bacterium]
MSSLSRSDLPAELRSFIAADVERRFLEYVQIHTTSDPNSSSNPSSACQLELVEQLERELKGMGLTDVFRDQYGYLYARLAGRSRGEAIGLLAHVDTSPDQPGDGVKPQVHRDWDGSAILFPEDAELRLTKETCPELYAFIGDSIITASGRTLLGADDKAGVAEIMSLVAALIEFKKLPHTDLVVCFTHDEEIGRGILGLDLSRLPRACYTVDGGLPGSLEVECFDAHAVDIQIEGVGVHPGYAKGRMINAAVLASRLVSMLPQGDTPERSDGREGFWHLTGIQGDHERATLSFILRDFAREKNLERIRAFDRACQFLQESVPGAKLTMKARQQYENMKGVLDKAPEVVERARFAIRRAGLTLQEVPIRGGTDGSLLSAAGHPTPNLFAGGVLFHSRREWIALSSMVSAVETLIRLVKPFPE